MRKRWGRIGEDRRVERAIHSVVGMPLSQSTGWGGTCARERADEWCDSIDRFVGSITMNAWRPSGCFRSQSALSGDRRVMDLARD